PRGCRSGSRSWGAGTRTGPCSARRRPSRASSRGHNAAPRSTSMSETTAPLDPARAAALLRASVATIRAELQGLPPALLAWHRARGGSGAGGVGGPVREAGRRGSAGPTRQTLASREAPRFSGWDVNEGARARRDCERDLDGLLGELGALRDASVGLVRSL